jgi:hypothetical protein
LVVISSLRYGNVLLPSVLRRRFVLRCKTLRRVGSGGCRGGLCDGTIAAGNATDLIVLDCNLFRTDVTSLHKTRVLPTLPDGKAVWRDPGFGRREGENVSRETFVDVPVLLALYFSCYQHGAAPVIGRTGFGASD